MGPGMIRGPGMNSPGMIRGPRIVSGTGMIRGPRPMVVWRTLWAD